MSYIKEAILHIFDLNQNEPYFFFVAGLDLTEKFHF